jgi:hypothetical protein
MMTTHPIAMTTYTAAEVRHLIDCACIHAFGLGKRWTPDQAMDYETVGARVLEQMEHDGLIDKEGE